MTGRVGTAHHMIRIDFSVSGEDNYPIIATDSVAAPVEKDNVLEMLLLKRELGRYS